MKKILIKSLAIDSQCYKMISLIKHKTIGLFF